MVSSVNQVRQFYVADENAAVVPGIDNSTVIQTVDVLGKTQSSDIIEPGCVDYVHLTAAAAMEIPMKEATVKLEADAFPDGKTISGQDYILRLNFRQFIGMSDEDIYQKYGAVHGTSSMTTGAFIAAMIYSLMKNMNREQGHLLDFVVDSTPVAKAEKSGSTITLYDADGEAISVGASEDEFTIVEAPQTDDWALGTKQLTRVQFDVIPTTVTEPDSYNEILWGTVTTAVSADSVVGNGYNIADMEYFFHGYRGDLYRNIGWPKSIPTKYMVDPTKTYDVLDIQYHYAGDNEDIQKSAKTITVVAEAGDDITSSVLYTLANDAAFYAGKASFKLIPGGGAAPEAVAVEDPSGDDTSTPTT